jgi:hypothetical protein
MAKHKFISIAILSAVIALPAMAATGHDSITKEQVAAAMSGAGMKVSADQVMLLTDVVASTSTPALRVESMERWGTDRMRVRLDCAKREDCLPFYVAIHWSEAGVASLAAPSAPPAHSKADPSSYVVRAGASVVLMLEGDHIHIRIPVVCLENGAAGQTIRVSSKDHRLTYTAEVVDGNVLKGNLR